MSRVKKILDLLDLPIIPIMTLFIFAEVSIFSHSYCAGEARMNQSLTMGGSTGELSEELVT